MGTVAIVDYGVGNMKSVANALSYLGCSSCITAVGANARPKISRKFAAVKSAMTNSPCRAGISSTAASRQSPAAKAARL